MSTAAEKAAAKQALSSATVAKRFVAAYLADLMYNEDGNLLAADMLSEMGLNPDALSPAQHDRFAAAAEYVAGRLDVMAGRPKPEAT